MPHSTNHHTCRCFCLTDALLDKLLSQSPASLSGLNLDGCISLTDAGINAISRVFAGRGTLARLNLSNCFRASSASIGGLLDTCGATLTHLVIKHMSFDEAAEDDDFAVILGSLARSQRHGRRLVQLDVSLNFLVSFKVLCHCFLRAIGPGKAPWSLDLRGCSLLLGREIQDMKNTDPLLTIEYDPFLLWDNSDESVHQLIQTYMSAEVEVVA